MQYKFLYALILFLSLCFIKPAEESIRIFMIGDSTMADKPTYDNPERGWGQLLPQFFDSSVTIFNHAKNGRSTRTFINEGRWDSVYNQLTKGDYVIIQFGHNDQSKEKVDRYTPPEDFKKNLYKFVKETREKGATPILCTPIMRRRFDSTGKFYDVHGVYPDLVREVARELNVCLVDMHWESEKVIIQHGAEGSKIIFLHINPGEYNSLPEGKKDDTHFSEYGAKLMAKIFIDEIMKINNELAQRVKKY